MDPDPLTSDDPARLAASFDRVADRLEKYNQASEDRDKALKKRDDQLDSYGHRNRWLVRVAIVSVTLDLVLSVVVTILFFTVHSTQQSATRQGTAVAQKICTTLGELGALKPPAGGSATSYPSRSYERALHAKLVQLGTDIGCKAARRP